MDLVWWLILLAIIVIGYLVVRAVKRSLKDQLATDNLNLREQRSISQDFYMGVLRREIANLCMQRDLSRFESSFLKLVDFEKTASAMSKEKRNSAYAALYAKFPDLVDMDLVGTKDYVPYEEADVCGDDQLFDHYVDLSKMIILGDEITRRNRKKLQDSLDHFKQTIQKIKDHRLGRCIDEAMHRYYRHKRYGRYEDKENRYEDDEYSVTYLPSGRPWSPATEWGIECKATGEYGIYAFFSHEEKQFHTYNRTDKEFKNDNYMSYSVYDRASP